MRDFYRLVDADDNQVSGALSSLRKAVTLAKRSTEPVAVEHVEGMDETGNGSSTIVWLPSGVHEWPPSGGTS